MIVAALHLPSVVQRWADSNGAKGQTQKLTQSGGSAAINGFLYQIVQHLDLLTEVSMSSTLDRDGFKHGPLILEPRGGGDAQA